MMTALSHQQTPEQLLSRLTKVILISTLLILTFSGVGSYWVYQKYIISNAEADAISIGESIVSLEKNLFLHNVSGVQGSQLIIDDTELEELDQTLAKFVTPFDILKIKVFSTEGEIIYSTDHSLIGRKNGNNMRLKAALSGQNDSKLQRKEEFVDLDNEKRFDVDVVETYLPIRNELGDIVGSFEIYQDTTKHHSDIYFVVFLSLAILAIVLSVIYSIAYLIVRAAVNSLSLAQKELQQQAVQDALTGQFNRREVMRLGENEFARCIRHTQKREQAFSLIMVDLDNFKQINDMNGHLGGDAVLRTVAKIMQEQVRCYDIVGRYGGEEFIIIIPDAQSSEAVVIAERIRKTVEQTPITFATTTINVTLSQGVATASKQDRSFEAVVKRADEALYQAKANGKNCVIDSNPTLLRNTA